MFQLEHISSLTFCQNVCHLEDVREREKAPHTTREARRGGRQRARVSMPRMPLVRGLRAVAEVAEVDGRHCAGGFVRVHGRCWGSVGSQSLQGYECVFRRRTAPPKSNARPRSMMS